MGKLKMLPGRGQTLPSRLRWAPGAEARQTLAWRKWYSTARWRALRKQVLEQSGFACARCGRVEGDTSQLVADHIEAHRGDAALFWDRRNLQCMCKRCHDRDKQREERAALHGGGV